jgi:peptidoglycan/xylan/chitin deacetylase (PgdA/CDA1 family)
MTKLTLTFDNGPTPGVTERVLEALASRGIKASFFLVGDRLADPGAIEIAAEAHAQGHWIGNHTMRHGPPLGDWSDHEASVDEIASAQEALGPLVHPRRFFRPNGRGQVGPHLLNATVVDYLVAHRYSVVLWSVYVRDSKEPADWAQRALDAIGAREWDILVLHDVPNGGMDSLPMFLDAILERGVTLEQDFPDYLVPIDRGVITDAAATILPQGVAL